MSTSTSPNVASATATAVTNAPMTIQTVANFPANIEVYLVLYGQQGASYVTYDWSTSTWKKITDGMTLPVFSTKTGTATNKPTDLATVSVPNLNSARLYVSYGKSPVFKGANGGLTQPNPYKGDDALHEFMVDKVEFTSQTIDNGMYELSINTTAVDFFGIPLQYEIAGHAGAGPKTPNADFKVGVTATREDIYNDIFSDPIFRRLLQRPDGGNGTNYYRAISPDLSISKGVDGFPDDWFDSYIDHCWSNVFKPNGAGINLVNINPLHVPVGVPTEQYLGKMDNGGSNELQFEVQTGGAGNWSTVATVRVDKPNTKQVFMGTVQASGTAVGSGTQTDVDNAIGFLTAQLSAAIVRTCLHVLDADGNSTSTTQATYSNFFKQQVAYYQNDAANGFTNDLYSEVLHNHSIDHKCYSSPYSDQYGFSTFKAVFNPTKWNVLLGY